jgi:hypothetical protein
MRQAGGGGVGFLNLQTANQDWLEQNGALADHPFAIGKAAKDFHLSAVRLANLHFGNSPRSLLATFNHGIIGMSDVQDSVGGSEQSAT